MSIASDRWHTSQPVHDHAHEMDGGDVDFGFLLLHQVRRYPTGGRGDDDDPMPPPAEALKAAEAPPDGRDCPICFEAEEEADMIGAWKETACGHRFHGRCVERWLHANGSCPVCRRRLLTPAPPPAAHRRDLLRTDEDSGNLAAFRLGHLLASMIPYVRRFL